MTARGPSGARPSQGRTPESAPHGSDDGAGSFAPAEELAEAIIPLTTILPLSPSAGAKRPVR
jgi:hypothetical protein